MAEVLRSVGRYDLLEVIGRGGTAVVYRAHQQGLGRQVALKELSPHHVGDPSFAQRFVEESRVAGAMSHPSIVTVHEFFEHDGLPYIAMEYLGRGSLRAYLGELSLGQLAAVLESVLAGLAHGQSHGVVHRDLKPENLLVAADGRVKIADFGVARAYNRAAPRAFVTATGTTIGTPAYMAPEQALGEELTPATDLYSLGIVAWESLAGRPPFEPTDTPMAVLYRQVHEPVPPITTVRPELAPGLVDWLDRMLAKRPEDRFPSASAAWDALEDVVIELLGPRWRREARLGDPPEPGPARTPTPVAPTLTDLTAPSNPTVVRSARRHVDAPVEAPPEPVRRSPWPLLVGIAVVLLVAGVAGYLAGHATRPARRPFRPPTVTSAANPAAQAATPILAALAATRARELPRLASAGSDAAHAGTAQALAGAYHRAAGRLGRLPAPEASTAGVRTLERSLDAVAGRWSSVAGAARAGDRGRYTAAATAAEAAERRLGAQIAALGRR